MKRHGLCMNCVVFTVLSIPLELLRLSLNVKISVSCALASFNLSQSALISRTTQFTSQASLLSLLCSVASLCG